jgi:hypothetical protein
VPSGTPAEEQLVAVTGYKLDSDRYEEAGFDDHLIKPVALNALQELIAAPAERPLSEFSQPRDIARERD